MSWVVDLRSYNSPTADVLQRESPWILIKTISWKFTQLLLFYLLFGTDDEKTPSIQQKTLAKWPRAWHTKRWSTEITRIKDIYQNDWHLEPQRWANIKSHTGDQGLWWVSDNPWEEREQQNRLMVTHQGRSTWVGLVWDPRSQALLYYSK